MRSLLLLMAATDQIRSPDAKTSNITLIAGNFTGVLISIKIRQQNCSATNTYDVVFSALMTRAPGEIPGLKSRHIQDVYCLYGEERAVMHHGPASATEQGFMIGRLWKQPEMKGIK